jgi:hypothetical protein
MMSGQRRILDGWGEIAACLTTYAEVNVSVQQARRYAARGDDPLPVRRIGRMFRRRVIAEPERVASWARREFAEG